jgi:ATP phosphoribosyltransferase
VGGKAKTRRAPGASREVGAAASTKRPLILALPKGRIMEQSIEIFGKAGYDLSSVLSKSRKLVRDCGPLQVLILRSADVPTYVHHGAADLGVVGSDVLLEQPFELYEPLDLGIGRCQMIVAEPADAPVDARALAHLRITSKYPAITRSYLDKKGLTAEIIKLSGSVELGPLTGLGDRIVDITESGETLRQNGLKIVDTIMEISTRLVVNQASLKLRAREISVLLERLAQQVV